MLIGTNAKSATRIFGSIKIKDGPMWDFDRSAYLGCANFLSSTRRSGRITNQMTRDHHTTTGRNVSEKVLLRVKWLGFYPVGYQQQGYGNPNFFFGKERNVVKEGRNTYVLMPVKELENIAAKMAKLQTTKPKRAKSVTA
eukprot:gene19579-26262_t